MALFGDSSRVIKQRRPSENLVSLSFRPGVTDTVLQGFIFGAIPLDSDLPACPWLAQREQVVSSMLLTNWLPSLVEFSPSSFTVARGSILQERSDMRDAFEYIYLYLTLYIPYATVARRCTGGHGHCRCSWDFLGYASDLQCPRYNARAPNKWKLALLVKDSSFSSMCVVYHVWNIVIGCRLLSFPN